MPHIQGNLYAIPHKMQPFIGTARDMAAHYRKLADAHIDQARRSIESAEQILGMVKMIKLDLPPEAA